MKKRISHTLLALCLVFSAVALDCNNALVDANELYKNGELNEAVKRIENCMSSFENSDERFEAQRLLALTYIALNNQDKAEEAIEALFKERPNYANYTQGQDPRALSQLILSYTVVPSSKLGFFAGLGANSVQVKRSLNPYNQGEHKYRTTGGYMFGFNYTQRINDKFDLDIRVSNQGGSIQHDLRGIDNIDILYKERYSLIAGSVALDYRGSLDNKLNWSCGPHLGYGYLLSDHRLVTHESLQSNDKIQYSSDGMPSRNKNQLFVGAHAGVSKDLIFGQLGFRVQYDHFTNTMANPETHLDDLDFELTSLYIGDELMLRNLSFQINFNFPISYRISK